MVSAEVKRRDVAIGQVADGLLYRSHHVLCPPGKRHDVTVVDQAEPVLERIVVRPALIVDADEAGLFADRARAEPRPWAVRGARIGALGCIIRSGSPASWSRSCSRWGHPESVGRRTG